MYVKCPRLSNLGGKGVKIGQNLVHVVVECPLSTNPHNTFLLCLVSLKVNHEDCANTVLKTNGL